MPTIRVKAICQKTNYGVQKPHLTGDDKYTKSAKHLRFNASDLGIDVSSLKGKESSEKKVSPNTNSTVAFEHEVSVEQAFRFLNKVDQSSKTEDYMRKATAYNEQKATVMKSMSSQDLEGAGKLKYYNALKQFCFTYYTVQYTVVIEDDNGNKKITESRKHYRLKKLSDDEFKAMLGLTKMGIGDTTPVIEAGPSAEA